MLISWASQQQAFKPAVQLDFTTGALDPRITFTRTSAATYVDASGRIVPTAASRNLLTFTQEFDNAAWTKANATVTANTAIAPDGTSTADKVVATNTASAYRAVARGAMLAATGYVYSIYAKAAEYSLFRIADSNSGRLYASFDLSNGTVVSGTTGGTQFTSASITSAGDGWYRCIVVFTGTAASYSFDFAGYPAGATLNAYGVQYAGDGTSGVLIWGAQLEAGSTATDYTRNNGGVYPPRFDYDPVTLAPRGLLVEEQRTNLLTYSEQFDDASWSKVRSSIAANSTTSPDGTASADTLVEDTTASNTHQVNRVFTGTAVAHTFSVYVKAAGRTQIRLALFDGTTFPNQTYFDLTSATVLSGTGGTITAVGNGWYRCAITATLAVSANCQAQIQLASGGTNTYTGDGTSGIFIWGAQLEAGAFATSYIPTAGSQVTRAADQASIVAPNFAPWYNQSEGTFVVEADTVKPTTTSATVLAIDASDGGINNRHYLGFSTGLAEGRTAVGGVTQVSLTQAYAANATEKLAYAYKANDFALARNGSLAGTDASGSLPTIDRMFIGNAAGSAAFLDGHIRSVKYFPTRLSNAQLQALSA